MDWLLIATLLLLKIYLVSELSPDKLNTKPRPLVEAFVCFTAD